MSLANITWTNPGDVGKYTVDGDNTFRRSAASSAWDCGAISARSIASGKDGYVTFKTKELATAKICGLTNGDPDYSYAGVDFGIFTHVGTSKFRVMENGSFVADLASYSAAGDLNQVLKISVESGVVKYYVDDVLKYTSLQSPTFPLIVDCSINSPNGTISECQFDNDTSVILGGVGCLVNNNLTGSNLIGSKLIG